MLGAFAKNYRFGIDNIQGCLKILIWDSKQFQKNQNIFNYKVVDYVEDYNFDIKFVFIQIHIKKLWIIFWCNYL